MGPPIIEIKRTLSGREKKFACSVLLREGSHLVVLFVSAQPMHVHGVDLPAGTVTLGHFWTDRPYNVYHWLDRERGTTIGYYVNLAAETTITAEELFWLDLVVDILIVPGQPPTVLDEDEIPANASQDLRDQIATAKAAALDDTDGLTVELDRDRAALWPSLFGMMGSPS